MHTGVRHQSRIGGRHPSRFRQMGRCRQHEKEGRNRTEEKTRGKRSLPMHRDGRNVPELPSGRNRLRRERRCHCRLLRRDPHLRRRASFRANKGIEQKQEKEDAASFLLFSFRLLSFWHVLLFLPSSFVLVSRRRLFIFL